MPEHCSQPRVSVISIFFNAEDYFEEAIESVLAQDHRDFELLLVDDGSADGSSAIALSYAARFPEIIRYLQHPEHSNRGMSAARNLGLREARGDYIAFIDADDRWRPAKLREQLELLERMPDVDAVGGSVNYWKSHDGGVDQVFKTGHIRERAIRPPEALMKLYPLGKATAPSMSDLMFRRSSMLAAGGFEESFKGAYEDQAFLIKFYLGSSLYLTNTVWSDYRLHPGSCMAALEKEGAYERVRANFLSWFERHLAASPHADNLHFWRALIRARRPSMTPGRPSFWARCQQTAAAALQRAQATAVHLSVNARERLQPWCRSGPTILMYHRLAEESFDPWELAVSPVNFADQLEWLKRNRTILPLAEFAALQEQGRLPPDAIALTFDDGYACSAKIAAPLLESAGVPATIYLPTDLIERGREFWWDDLERIILGHEGQVLTLAGQEVDVGELQPDDHIWRPRTPPRTPRQRAYREIWSALYHMNPSDQQRALKELRAQASTPEAPRDSHRPLTVQEIRAMRSKVVQFGAHSLSHAALPALRSEAKSREIVQSLARCEEICGARPLSFAYPYGSMDEESEELVRQAGFRFACKADGWSVTRKSNAFALPRMLVGNWQPAQLARQLGRT